MKLTPEQIEHLENVIRLNGKARADQMHDDFHEADFLAGAMCAYFAFDVEDALPQWWFIGVMAGRPVLLEPEQHEAIKRAQEERRRARQQLVDLKARLRPLEQLKETVVHAARRVARQLEESEEE